MAAPASHCAWATCPAAFSGMPASSSRSRALKRRHQVWVGDLMCVVARELWRQDLLHQGLMAPPVGTVRVCLMQLPDIAVQGTDEFKADLVQDGRDAVLRNRFA